MRRLSLRTKISDEQFVVYDLLKNKSPTEHYYFSVGLWAFCVGLLGVVNGVLDAAVVAAAAGAAVPSTRPATCVPARLRRRVGVVALGARLQHVGEVAAVAVSGRARA